MRGGIILIVIGLFVGFLAVSGKYCCLTQLWSCATSESDTPCKCTSTEATTATKPTDDGWGLPSWSDLMKPLDIPGFSIFPYTF